MFVLSSVVVLATCLQVITSQGPPDIPPHCRGPPPGVTEHPTDCCKIPPIFEASDFEECGFQKSEQGGPPKGHHGPPDCSKQLCMLEKYNLAKDGDIDQEAVSAFMDEYGKTNEAFQPTVETAKERCLGKDLPGPPHMCEANKVIFCIGHTLFSECPVWEESDGCKALKEHMEECLPHFKRQ